MFTPTSTTGSVTVDPSHKPDLSYDPHKFTGRICHWEYCVKCGLVALRNTATGVAIKLGCNWADIEAARKPKGKR